jgi:hypothetical protein
MNFLDHGVWSKRTTRRIVVIAIIVLVAAWTGSDAWFFIQQNWLTPGERMVASEALASIDELQDSKNLDEDQFNERETRAKLRIDSADKKAWTMRDQGVVTGLRMYLMKTVTDRKLTMRTSPNQVAMREAIQKFAPELDNTTLGASLHKTLGQ